MILLAVVGLSLLVMPPAEAELVLRGLDPVELCAGRETPGREASAVDRDGLRYLFANDENRARFEAEPERFAVQMGGGCGRMGLPPHAREVSFDGQRDEALSGPVDALEVDPVIGEELFARRG